MFKYWIRVQQFCRKNAKLLCNDKNYEIYLILFNLYDEINLI